MTFDYRFLLKTPTKDKWKRITVRRRAGVAVPLFSVYSGKSTGIGDINDLKILIDWCRETGLTILQLLPLNEVGNDFSPYNSISSFAIEPMYISLNSLFKKYRLKDTNKFTDLRKKFRSAGRVDYRVKNEKIKILRNIFNKIYQANSNELNDFINKNEYWIKDYAQFKTLIDKRKKPVPPFPAYGWVNSRGGEREVKTFLFYCWVQRELHEQLTEVKKYAEKNNILLMGDMPLLVSRYSADVWSHRKYFKMNFSAGAPPDIFYKYGQLWGMPPYNWSEVEKDNYIYIKERLKYAGNFFDMFRIDHFIGLFRIWMVKQSKKKDAGREGRFDPKNEDEWEEQAKKILNAMTKNIDLLPCAEDLGTVPACSPQVLKEYGTCGTDWQRTLQNKTGFVPYHKYRKNSIAVISTHDSSLFSSWWDHEAKDKERKKLLNYLCRKVKYSQKCTQELIEANLETINLSASIFSIQLMQEWLALDPNLFKEMNKRDYRINYPGVVSKNNWTVRMPLSLEKIGESKIMNKVRKIITTSER